MGLTGLIYLGNQSIPHTHPPDNTIPDSAYAGSAACVSCHKDISKSHLQTAHYHTSQPASAKSVKGSFNPGRNRFTYNSMAEVVMETNSDGLWQTAYWKGNQVQQERFDVVIGSGKKGQTYLYWKDDYLFQLPVSYYVPLHDWCNSPGYPKNYPRFNRLIPAHCLECHGTYAQTAIDANGATHYPERDIIYGVDCERCHGPAAAHVAWHTQHPAEKTGKYILNAHNMTRQQRLDACALCHSGQRDELKPAFSFQTGDRLDDFSKPVYSSDSLPTLDVHGNQYGLLLASKCFQQSDMDCSTCHNVHANEANKLQVFSQRCMTCHNGKDHPVCALPGVAGSKLANNCIDCHMPALPSQKIFLQLSDTTRNTPDLVRTHRIAIYANSGAGRSAHLPPAPSSPH